MSGRSSRIAYGLLDGTVGLTVGGESRPGGPRGVALLFCALGFGAVSFHS